MNYRQKDKKYKLWSAMSAAILLLSFGGIASAATEEVSCGEHATYKIYDSGALIISGSGTIIGFSDNTVRVNAQTVSIDFDGDEDVTEIGEDAFANFEVLSSVVIGDGLRKIGKDAFRGCKALYNVDLPNTLTEIGESAFESAGRLERYTLPEQLKSIKARAFYGTGSDEIIIPASVTEIGAGAFGGCKDLKKIELKGSCTGLDALLNGSLTGTGERNGENSGQFSMSYEMVDGSPGQMVEIIFKKHEPGCRHQRQVTVTASPAQGGAVSGGGSYILGDTVMIDAKAAQGYHFKCWMNGSTTFSTENQTTFPIQEAMAGTIALTAVFEKDPEPQLPADTSDTWKTSSSSKKPNVVYMTMPKENASESDTEQTDSLGAAGESLYVFTALLSRATDHSLRLDWSPVSEADGYMIYGNRCSTRQRHRSYRLLKTVSAKKTSIRLKKLKKGAYYKYYVVAYRNVGEEKVPFAVSFRVHGTTTGGKYGMAEAVLIQKAGKKKYPEKITMKQGQRIHIKAKEISLHGRIRSHRKLAYGSSDPEIADISADGKITAKAKGKCRIYVFAQNGNYNSLEIKVK